MSTGRRSSRLSLLASPEKDDNAMDVDESSEDESIEDFTTKKTPSKRASLASSSSTKSKAKKSKKPSNSSEMDLFAIISDGAVLSTAVTDWLDTYCSNADGKLESTAVLVQLVFQTALLTGDLPKDVVSNSKVEAINEAIDERLEEVAKSNKETPEFPLTPKSKMQRKFQSAYARFWKVLVEEGSDSAFSDDFLLNRLITWLTRLVYAPYRPLRFAAAVSAFHLMKSLVTNLEKLTSQLSKRQKQIDSEAKLSGKKSGGASSSTSKSKLESDLKAMKARGETVEKAVKKLWSEVFGAVWHDQSIEMRRLSIEALGEWCIQYPKYFMDSDRFKYLVWLMGDSDPGCRATSLQVLLELLDKEDLRTQMRMYTSKLIERLYNLAKETSHDHVAIHAILVLARLRELFGADFVNSEVVEYVQHQVSVDNPDIRAAAGTFITVDIVGELEEGEDEPKKSGKNSRPNSTSNKRVLKGKAVTQLRNMLNFIENSTDHTDMPYYVVDAIWDNDKDFFLFAFGDSADLLLIPSTSKQRLSDSQQALLAKSVLATVSRLSGKAMSNIRSAPIPKADVTKQLLSSFTETYYPIIPELLLTHQADHDVLIPVLSLANHLDMDHLAKQADGKKSALLLIQNIKKIFTTTTQEAVLKKCSSVLEHLASNSTLQRNVDSTLVNIVSTLTETLNTYVEKFDVPGSSQVGKPKKRATELESADFVDGAAPGTAELVLCLLRLEVLSRYFDLNRIDSSILEAVVKVVETRGGGRFRVVGPRSAFSATTLFATLVAYKFNELPIGDPNNTSKSIDQMDYDISQRKIQQRAQKDTGDDEEEEGNDNDDEDDNDKTPKRKTRNSLGGAKPKAKQTGTAAAAVPMPTERELLDFATLVNNAITKMMNMLDLKADDTDMEDLAPFGAFRAISSLLLLFSRKLTDTPLEALVYKPTVELVAALIKFFEAEMEKPADEYDASVRCETVLNSFTSLIVCDIFEGSWEVHLPKVIAQLRQENEKSQTMVRNLLKDLRDGYGNPASYAQLLVDTLTYELQLKSDDPETQDDDEDKAMRMRRLARSLERSFPIGKDYAANTCKLVINKLVEQSLKDPDFAPLLTWASFFVVKVTPAGARDLLNSFKTRFDVTFASLEGLEAPYEELKEQLKDRATGTKRAKATGGAARGGKKKTTKKIKDAGDEDEDGELEKSAEGDEEDDQVSQASSTTYTRINPRHKMISTKEAAKTTTPKKAAVKKAVTKTESAKKSVATPKRASAKRAGRASISVIHQGNSADVSMGADSEMAHTDDEASDHEDLPKTVPAVAHPKRPAVTRTSIAVISASNREEEEGGVGESMDVDEPVTGSQMSVEIPMTDSGAAKLSHVVSKKKGFSGRGDQVGAGEGDLEESVDEPEPRTSRPKRGRLSHLSQASETSATSPSQRSMRSRKKGEESEEGGASEDEEDHPASDVDSDDLMDHTPSTKRRRAPSRS